MAPSPRRGREPREALRASVMGSRPRFGRTATGPKVLSSGVILDLLFLFQLRSTIEIRREKARRSFGLLPRRTSAFDPLIGLPVFDSPLLAPISHAQDIARSCGASPPDTAMGPGGTRDNSRGPARSRARPPGVGWEMHAPRRGAGAWSGGRGFQRHLRGAEIRGESTGGRARRLACPRLIICRPCGTDEQCLPGCCRFSAALAALRDPTTNPFHQPAQFRAGIGSRGAAEEGNGFTNGVMTSNGSRTGPA